MTQAFTAHFPWGCPINYVQNCQFVCIRFCPQLLCCFPKGSVCCSPWQQERFASVFFKSLVLLFIQRALEPQHFLTVAGLKDVLDPKSWSHSLCMYQFSPSRRKWRTVWHSHFFSLLHKFLYEHNRFILLLSNNCRCNFRTKMQSANCFII